MWEYSGPAFPILISFFIYFFYCIVIRNIMKVTTCNCCKKSKSKIFIEEIGLVELQPNYMDVIKHHDITWVIKEQEYYLNHYAVPSYGLETHNYYALCYQDKRNLKCDASQHILGTHNYDILMNVFYQEHFQYYPVKLPHGCKDRNLLI